VAGDCTNQATARVYSTDVQALEEDLSYCTVRFEGRSRQIKIASLEPKWHKDCDDDPPARHTLLPKLLLRIVLDLLYTNSFGAQTLLPALPYLFFLRLP